MKHYCKAKKELLRNCGLWDYNKRCQLCGAPEIKFSNAISFSFFNLKYIFNKSAKK